MDFAELYSFLFETYTGIGILIGASIVICIIVCFIMEARIRKIFQDRGPRSEDEEDDWFFSDDEDEEEGD
ncbi:MAG: hypothetical protein J5804_04620 [Eggerthellaceae bacterium]|nr:hypothetical protein [Eggerthellaceae bacterium]